MKICSQFVKGDETPCDEDFFTWYSFTEPKLFVQADLNDLVPNLQLAEAK